MTAETQKSETDFVAVWREAQLAAQPEHLLAAQAAVTEHFEKGYAVDWSLMNRLATAQFGSQIAARIARRVDNTGKSVSEAWDDEVEYHRERVLNNWMRASSTDPMSNALTEIEREVVCRFIAGQLPT